MRWTDWALIGVAVLTMLCGPIMAIQELANAQAEKAAFDVTGTLPPVDPATRDPWRIPLTALVLVVGILATFTVARAVLDTGTRPLVGRLVGLMLSGLALLYVTYYVDGAFFWSSPYALRGTTIVWLYPAAGALLAGSAWRIGQVHAYFGRSKQRSGDVVL